jgi:hypothetical protein
MWPYSSQVPYSNSFHLFFSTLLVTAAITCDAMPQCLKVWKCLLTYKILHTIPKAKNQHNYVWWPASMPCHAAFIYKMTDNATKIRWCAILQQLCIIKKNRWGSLMCHHVKAWMIAPCSFQHPIPLPPPQGSNDGLLHHTTHVFLVSLSKWVVSGGLPVQAQKICLFTKLLKWNTNVTKVSLLSVLSSICLLNVFQVLQSSSLISWCKYNLKAYELKHLCITL